MTELRAVKDYNLEVLRGNVTGHTMISIMGHNEIQGTTELVVHPADATSDIDQSVIFATPADREIRMRACCGSGQERSQVVSQRFVIARWKSVTIIR